MVKASVFDIDIIGSNPITPVIFSCSLMVEQTAVNRQVIGSSPIMGVNYFEKLFRYKLWYIFN